MKSIRARDSFEYPYIGYMAGTHQADTKMASATLQSPLSGDVQAHLCSLLGIGGQDSDSNGRMSGSSIETNSGSNTPAQQHSTTDQDYDFSGYDFFDACSEKSSGSVRSCSALTQFGLNPETFDRVGGWENLSIAVEEARVKIQGNQDLARALSSPFAEDSSQSPYEMTTALISSLAGLVLQSTTFEGRPHYFHLHFSSLWALEPALVTALADCIVNPLIERDGVQWPGDDIVQATPKYHSTVATLKIKSAFATLANYRPHLTRVDEDDECEQTSNQRSHTHVLSRFGCQSNKSSPLSSRSLRHKFGRSSMDSVRVVSASVQDVMAAYGVS